MFFFFFFGERIFAFLQQKKSGKLWKNLFFKRVISTNFAILGANFAKISTSQV